VEGALNTYRMVVGGGGYLEILGKLNLIYIYKNAKIFLSSAAAKKSKTIKKNT